MELTTDKHFLTSLLGLRHNYTLIGSWVFTSKVVLSLKEYEINLEENIFIIKIKQTAMALLLNNIIWQ
jgi:hypothetical protein